MGRYICVFYDTKNRENVNKTNKKVKVLECGGPGESRLIINTVFKTDLIKSIRDIESMNYWLHDKDLRLIEDRNNFKL
jgi:hypothetical protein